MDKSTGAELLINGETVTGQTEFVPESAEGTVDVTFTFNADGFAGKEVVVFEKLYLMLDGKAIPVTSHEDLSDQGQTVKAGGGRNTEDTGNARYTGDANDKPATDRRHYEPGFVDSHSASVSRRNRMWHLENPQEKKNGG